MSATVPLAERGWATEQGAVRVGIDLSEIAATRRSLERFGERFVGRVFTSHEADSCRTPHDPTGYAVGSLAARFAAKEAALKVLRPSDVRPEWRSMEVRRHANGWCEMVLSGAAAELAEEQGLAELAVSLTHEGPIAAAVVYARSTRER